jgi:putative oxidoreductase
MNFAYALGRILVPLIFLVAGVQKAMNVAATAKLLADANIPIPEEIVPYLGGIPKYEALVYLIAAVEIVCALMVLVGLKARWGALILAVDAACTIIFVHHFWDMDGAALVQHRGEALKYLSILGGLLLIVAVGSGPGSVENR